MKITALAGGVGGARLLSGLATVLPEENLSVIVNTGDDFEWNGLYVCPDIDTITYTLAAVADRERGWGIRNDSFNCLDRLCALGEDDWFKIGDGDLATHILRTKLLRGGWSLSKVTADLCRRNGIRTRLIPMADTPMPTLIHTESGVLEFQDYFVRRRCAPVVKEIEFRNAGVTAPAPCLLESIGEADVVILCPSNPFISIGPILAIPGVRTALWSCRATVIAVTPIIGGKAVKGPTAAMLHQMGLPVSAAAVASLYRDFIDVFVLDEGDVADADKILELRIRPVTAPALMPDMASRTKLAAKILELLK
jgi:LPPG:FO 2-phospho-L-lactate transferase